MKKIIFVVVILLLATLCLTACEQPVSQYDKFATMVSQSYSQIKMDITVKNSADDGKLVSSIVCNNIDSSNKIVVYVLQEYTTFDINGDTITAPNAQIVTKSGAITFANNQVSEQTGDAVDYDFSKLGKLNMKFDKSYFANAVIDGHAFTADVTNMAQFLGTQIAGATNVKISVDVQTYNSITLSYTANGSDVTITYTLAK